MIFWKRKTRKTVDRTLRKIREEQIRNLISYLHKYRELPDESLQFHTQLVKDAIYTIHRVDEMLETNERKRKKLYKKLKKEIEKVREADVSVYAFVLLEEVERTLDILIS